MDPLDKLEMIILGEREELESKLKIYRANDGPYSTSHFTIDRLENQIDTLSWIWTELNSIRSNGPSTSDEIVKKMYGSKSSSIIGSKSVLYHDNPGSVAGHH